MTRPRLLDLFCGAGGAATGYHRAGFDVVGVDIRPQPRYPFEFVQGDAFWATCLVFNGDWSFGAIHASPPCQHYSAAAPQRHRANHPDLLGRVRAELTDTGLPWVIENVPGAPMRPDLKLCGCMFGLPNLKRERWFETSWQAFGLRQPCSHKPGDVISVTGTGGGTGHTRAASFADWRRAMGIDWMTGRELAQAIPPAYTEHIGLALLAHLRERAA